MLTIGYYITGHGLGHATRSIGLIQHLLNTGAHVTIISSVKGDFFYSNLKYGHDALQCTERSLDTGAVQTDPITVDPLATLEAYYNIIHTKRSHLIESETAYLTSMERRFDVMLTDATSIICRIAKMVNIKAILVSNFSWDYIYSEMLQSVRGIIDEALYRRYADMVEECSRDYSAAYAYIRLPATVPLTTAFNHTTSSPLVLDAPLLCRKATTDKDKLREYLGISKDVKVVVIGFGGHASSRCLNLSDASLPHGWIGLIFGVSSEELINTKRFTAVPYDVYMPDYINLADVVLGKIGYGTVSECLAHGIPLIFVPRSNWPEEPHVVKYIASYNAAVQLDADDFYGGRWTTAINSAYSRKNAWDVSSLKVEYAIPIIVDHILTSLKT